MCGKLSPSSSPVGGKKVTSGRTQETVTTVVEGRSRRERDAERDSFRFNLTVVVIVSN